VVVVRWWWCAGEKGDGRGGVNNSSWCRVVALSKPCVRYAIPSSLYFRSSCRFFFYSVLTMNRFLRVLCGLRQT
jgi:hypothetical protein